MRSIDHPRDDFPPVLDIPSYPSRYQVNLPANDPNASTLGLSFLGSDVILDLELSALEADGEGEVISTPRVITANQAEAFIQQGVEIPYQQSASSGATTVQFKKAVLSLTVTPQISEDGQVTMDVNPVLTRVAGVDESFDRESTAPRLDIKQSSTLVRMHDGETIVVGGLIQETLSNTDRAVPVIGEVPGFGQLFSANYDRDVRKELVIFITPHIIE